MTTSSTSTSSPSPTPPPETSPKPEFTLTHVIENVSQLTSTRRSGPTVSHFNIPWRLGYQKTTGFFGFQLNCDYKSPDPWSVDANFVLRIRSPCGKFAENHLNYVFAADSQFVGYGFRDAYSWDAFVDEMVINDRTVIEAHVVVNQMSGIEKPAKLRGFDDEKKGDVVLVVGGEKFHVSKLYLASVSSYFNTLFLGPFEENGKPEIELKGIDPEHFQIYLELIHMELTLTDSNVESVMTLVDMYDTKNAHRLCEDFLMHKSKNSTKNKLRMAQKFKMHNLKDYCISTMKSTADIRAATSAGLDPEILGDLFQKSLSF